MKIDPHDAVIISKLAANMEDMGPDRELFDFDERINEAVKNNDYDLSKERDRDEIIYYYGIDAAYKLDKEGRVYFICFFITESFFPILKRIPPDLLELQHLKYLNLFCDVDINKIPSSITNNKDYIVQTNKPDPNSFLGKTCNKFNISGYELKIIQKDILSEIDNNFEQKMLFEREAWDE